MDVRAEWDERRSRTKPERRGDPRKPYDHDLARVIHSASFRRLQRKTQVLGLGEGDFYRTRLTHSIEVAQIATGIRRTLDPEGTNGPYSKLLPTVPQLTAIALAHDIGHPPFGHGGEVALNYMMRGKGGFEGNAQTLRILAILEGKTKAHGLDLTRRTMLGVLKYPAAYGRVAVSHQKKQGSSWDTESFRAIYTKAWSPPKCYFDDDDPIVQWILEPLTTKDRELFQSCSKPKRYKKGNPDHGKPHYKSLDTTLMDHSDDISYAVHDLEDAIHMKFIRDSEDDRSRVDSVFNGIESEFLTKYSLEEITEDLFGEKWQRKEAISKLVHCLICSTDIVENLEFDEPLLRYQVIVSDTASKLIKALKRLVDEKVIFTPEVQTLEYSGQQLIMELFEAMHSSPNRLLPSDTQKKLEDKGGDARARVVCDHISGMTDDYAANIYERLFTTKTGSLFQKM